MTDKEDDYPTITAKFEMSLWWRIKAACGVWWAIVVTKEVECVDDEATGEIND